VGGVEEWRRMRRFRGVYRRMRGVWRSVEGWEWDGEV